MENRTQRKNVELCRDIPQYQLCHEVAEIEGSLQLLHEKLEIAEKAHKNLLLDLARIEEDLRIKSNSLALDNECMKTREKLVGDASPQKKHTSEVNPYEDISTKLRDMKTQDTVIPEKEGSSVRRDSKNVTFVDQNGHIQTKIANPLEKSTYNADYEEYQNKRSGDLQRTLGRPVQTTMSDSYTKEALLA